MNLHQMQMVYDHAPNGRLVLRPASPPIKFWNGHPVRVRQAQHRATKGGYQPGHLRPRHDCDRKV